MSEGTLWWQRPMAILGHSQEYAPGYRRDPAEIEELVRWKVARGFDAEHLLVNYSMFEGTGGEDSRAYLFANFHGCREDWLGTYLPIARRHGLRVLVYFNCHWFKPDTFPADYYVVGPDGTPKVIYGDGGEICCRGPFRAWSERIAEDLGSYPIAGVFLDGPVKDACWCPHCRAAFRTATGQELPDDPAALPPGLEEAYADFIDEIPVGYIEAFGRGLRRQNPEAILYCNGGDSRQMRATLPWTQLIGEEGGFVGYGPLDGEFPFVTGRPAREMEYRARGRARVIFCDSGYKVYDYHIHPAGEVARMYAGTLASGANAWYIVYRPDEAAPGTQVVYRFNRLLHEHGGALANGESLAEAAIVHSPRNLRLAGTVTAPSGDDVHRREAGAQRLAVPRHAEEYHGLFAALCRSGYPFDVIDDDDLLDGLLPARVKLLLLPGMSAVSDRLAAWLRSFVAGGGRLLATFDTSLYDEHGMRRPDYALADLFGAGAAGELIGPSSLDYLGIAAPNPLTRGIAQRNLPCPEYWQHVAPAPGAEALLHYYGKMPRRYAALPPLSDAPAALRVCHGAGEAIFIPSAIGTLSLRYRFPDIRLLLRNAAQWLAPPPVTVEGGDEFVETTLRRGADGAVVVHLVNWASGERPSSRAIPLGPLRVRVRLPEGLAPAVARLAMAETDVALERDGAAVAFTVPRLEEYEAAILR